MTRRVGMAVLLFVVMAVGGLELTTSAAATDRFTPSATSSTRRTTTTRRATTTTRRATTTTRRATTTTRRATTTTRRATTTTRRATTTTRQAAATTTTRSSSSACDAAYPSVCIPPAPPDLDCGEISFVNFTVRSPDPHRFDGDHDGIGCEEG